MASYNYRDFCWDLMFVAQKDQISRMQSLFLNFL